MGEAWGGLAAIPEIDGLGVDIVSLARFGAFLERHGEALQEVFTPAELAGAAAHPRLLYLATRWALKEAALKALGTGWGEGIAWTDVEAAGGTFAPRLCARGAAARLLAVRGAPLFLGSVSCARDYALAVVLLGRGPARAGRA